MSGMVAHLLLAELGCSSRRTTKEQIADVLRQTAAVKAEAKRVRAQIVELFAESEELDVLIVSKLNDTGTG